MDRRARRYREFWPLYLGQHRHRGNRTLHLAGTGSAIALLAAALATLDWRLVPAAVVIAYGFAWTGHAFLEGNAPATFTHPFWSLMADVRMFFLFLTGRLDRELRRQGFE